MAAATTTSLPADVAALVNDAASGKFKSIYVFAGESFLSNAAAHAVAEALVPEASRSFNLETYDGRSTPLGTVLDSLRMRGFFAGVKVVWLRDTPLFLSGEKRSDLTKTMLAAWADSRQVEAAEQMLTLVAMAGWAQEQFLAKAWTTAPKSHVKEVFGDGLEDDEVAALDAIQAVCRQREMKVAAFRDEGGQLQEFLDAGMPSDAVLLLTAPAVDARKKLTKRVREVGAVVELAVERERSGALGKESIDSLIQRIVRADFAKQLEPAATELVLRRAGNDVGLVASELEKLCLAVGDRAKISEADVRMNFQDMAASWIFDFTAALSTRQVARALPLLRGLLDQGEPPLRLLGMLAREVRMLLLARECLETTLRGIWRGDVQYNAFQSRVLPEVDRETLDAFGRAHPFVLFRRFQDAARISSVRLRKALVDLADLDLRFKSSRNDPKILLEAFVLRFCQR